MATLDDAITLAVKAHQGVKDKSGQPYILHPLRVMFSCDTEAERIVAVLHDVVEDTPYTFDDLLGFDEQVLAALDSVTKRDGEEYEAFIARAAANPIGRKVKLADLKDNMDFRRLPSLEEKDVARLQKYLKAWRRLTGT